MSFRDKFTKVERDFTPLYRAHHSDVEGYWAASIEGVPQYDPASPSGASLIWRCILMGKSSIFKWTTETLDEAFASLEEKIGEVK